MTCCSSAIRPCLILLADAKVGEDEAEYFVGGDGGACDKADLFDRLTEVGGDEIAGQAVVESLGD